jgi:hypothetical protein
MEVMLLLPGNNTVDCSFKQGGEMVVFKIPVEHNGGYVAPARKQCWNRNPGISNMRIQFCTYILSANLFTQYICRDICHAFKLFGRGGYFQ